MESESDNSVMRSVQEGETAKLAVLFERYHVQLFRYLLHLTGNRSLSEDLVQEVFFRVLKYGKSYNPEQSFPVWLYQMARNVHFDLNRKRRSEVAPDELPEIKSPEPLAEELFTHKQNMAFLETALSKLPSEKREVLVLSRFQNLRYDEIARILKCEVGTVKVRVYRALRELRETFSELRGETVL